MNGTNATTQTLVGRAAARSAAPVARRVRGMSDRAIAWLFILPTMVLLLAINIFPLIWAIRLSFTGFMANLPNPARFIGIDNYIDILTDEDLWTNFQITANFVFWTIALQVLIGLGLALLINQKFRGHSLWTTVILLPMMLSPAVVGNFWTLLFQPQIGPFNYVVGFFTGLAPSSFTMIGSVSLAPWTIVLVNTWMWTPVRDADWPRRAAVNSRLHLRGGRGGSRVAFEAILVHHVANGPAVPHAGRAVPGDPVVRHVRHGQSPHVRGTGIDHGTGLNHAQARRVRKMGDQLRLGPRRDPLCHDIRRRERLREGAQLGETAMSVAPSPRPFSEPSPFTRRLSAVVVVIYAVVAILPLAWIGATAFKSQADAIAYPPKVFFTPTLEGFVDLFTVQTHQPHDFIEKLPRPRHGTRRSPATVTW